MDCVYRNQRPDFRTGVSNAGCGNQTTACGSQTTGWCGQMTNPQGSRYLSGMTGYPLAMAYVPWQRLDEMYTPETALERGTLYPELDKPFMGCTVMSGQNGVCRRAAGSTANERRCQNG